MEKEIRNKIQLSFGDLAIRKNEIWFNGRGRGTAFRDGQSIDVPAAGPCLFKVTPGRLIGVLTEALMKKDEETEENRPYRTSFRGRDGVSFLIGSVPKRKAVRLSVAKLEDRNVTRRSSGLLWPAVTLVIMDAAGKILRNTRQHIIPIQGIASLYCKDGKMTFIEKEGGALELEDYQKRELRFLLTARLIHDFPIRFQAGPVRITEDPEKGILFRFGRYGEAVMPNDNIGIIWALSGENREGQPSEKDNNSPSLTESTPTK